MRAGTLRLRLWITAFCFNGNIKLELKDSSKLSLIANQCLSGKKLNFYPFLTDDAKDLFSSNMKEFHLEASGSENAWRHLKRSRVHATGKPAPSLSVNSDVCVVLIWLTACNMGLRGLLRLQSCLLRSLHKTQHNTTVYRRFR